MNLNSENKDKPCSHIHSVEQHTPPVPMKESQVGDCGLWLCQSLVPTDYIILRTDQPTSVPGEASQDDATLQRTLGSNSLVSSKGGPMLPGQSTEISGKSDHETERQNVSLCPQSGPQDPRDH